MVRRVFIAAGFLAVLLVAAVAVAVAAPGMG